KTMARIDDIFPDIGVVPTTIVVAVIAIALQLSGAWITMLIAGVIGALFTRDSVRAFLAGLFGVAAGWGILYVYLIMTAQAAAIAEFFIGLLGLSGMGWLVFVIGALLGGFLGGFGGLLGRSIIDLIDEIQFPDETKKDEPAIDDTEELIAE
ncbi:MAG: hypothetical protein P1Q69_14855, partial [Candidatus Thorarchaeota archaeon]|nr:hypothetical protein [Candidatus Thorarchaeota archaeon]